MAEFRLDCRDSAECVTDIVPGTNMKLVEVLGFDCPTCRKTYRPIDNTSREPGD